MKCAKIKWDATKIIFILYCMVLIWIVLCKTAFSLDDILRLRCPRSINLIPFYYADDVEKLHMREVILNVLTFVPLGLYLKMLGATGRRAVFCGFCISLGFELCQFALAIGASDVTDVITNTFGTFAGMCLYMLAGKIFSDKQKTDKIINVLAAVLLLIFFCFAVLVLVANRL